jgi:hypothetical protein
MFWAVLLVAWVVFVRRGMRWRRWRRQQSFGMWMNPYQRMWLLEHNRARYQHMQFGPQPHLHPQPAPEPPLSPAQAKERKIAEVRKRYVADEITVEDYEREVDAILKH